MRSPWGAMHAMIAYGVDTELIAGDKRVNAIGYLCYNGVCTTITESSILMACQFGCGTGGKLDNFIRNGYSCDGPNKTTDGNGTSICKYLVSGAGHNIEAITGNASPETGSPEIPGGFTSNRREGRGGRVAVATR